MSEKKEENAVIQHEVLEDESINQMTTQSSKHYVLSSFPLHSSLAFLLGRAQLNV